MEYNFNELKTRVEKLKKEQNAVILAHYYVPDDVQALADYIGDSYGLAKLATQVDADEIIFCGVDFMGQSAKILNPTRRVFLPSAQASCPMAHMITADAIKEMRSRYDDLTVVCYVNSTAEIKALSDVCVTSSNALKIVKKLPGKNIFFIPDGNLGHYIKEQCPEKNVIPWKGYCLVHAAITIHDVEKARIAHPQAKLLAHPECPADILNEADYIGSTKGIIDAARTMPDQGFIIATECGVLCELHRQCPGKTFYTVHPNQICVNMKRVTADKVLDALVNHSNEVFMPEDIAAAALKPLQRMIELAES